MAVGSAAANADVPELHNLEFDDRTTIAPGMVVSYKSIPRPDTAVVRDQCDIKIDFTIRHSGHIIYRDTTSGCEYDLEALEPATRQWYPHWIPAGRDAGEALITVATHISLPISRRFFIRDGHVTKIDTIPVFDEPARNLDQDSWLELAAYQTLTETWTDEQGREWQGYNPKLYYEVRPTGLVLDSALTKRKAVAQYGVFRGFEASEEIKLPTRQSKSK